MSKTFKNATNSGTEVYVGEGINAYSVQLIIRNVGSGIGKAGIYLNSSDIPALALAILEAAGVEAKSHEAATVPYGTPAHLGMIASHLKAYAEAKSMNDAEAEALAKLEAEALELFNARQKAINSFDWEPYKDFANEDTKQTWLAVARKARELNKEEK